jgi:hypothetical protein
MMRRSVSDDDDEDAISASSRTTITADDDPHAALVKDVMHPQDGETENRGDAIAYLLRYETMVRQQEAEDMAVLAHIRPCVSRLLQLLGVQHAMDDVQFVTQEISFQQLKQACNNLEEEQEKKQRTEFITSDRQLMMVLRLLTQKVSSDSTTCITWAEFIQCYKVCIAGMLTLQHLPPDSAVRERAKDRTLAMLSLFEPPSTQLFHEDAVNSMHHQAAASTSKNTLPPGRKVVDSAPLAAATRGEFAARAMHPVSKQPALRKQRPWLKRKTKRTLLVLTLLLCALYPVMIYVSVQFTSSSHEESATPSSKRGAPTLEPHLFKSSPAATVSEPLVDNIKPALFPKVNSSAVKPTKRRHTNPIETLLGAWSDLVDPAARADAAVETERVTAPVAAAVVLAYLTAGVPMAMTAIATISVGAAVKGVVSTLPKVRK